MLAWCSQTRGHGRNSLNKCFIEHQEQGSHPRSAPMEAGFMMGIAPAFKPWGNIFLGGGWFWWALHGGWWCVWVRVLSEPVLRIAPAARSPQSKEIKGAILVFVTNKMVMGFPSGCYFSWSPLLWSFGFLQLLQTVKKRKNKGNEGRGLLRAALEPPEVYSPSAHGAGPLCWGCQQRIGEG